MPLPPVEFELLEFMDEVLSNALTNRSKADPASIIVTTRIVTIIISLVNIVNLAEYYRIMLSFPITNSCHHSCRIRQDHTFAYDNELLFLYAKTSKTTAMIAIIALKGNGTITLNKIKTITIMIVDLIFILYH